jgi:hypothetical protein
MRFIHMIRDPRDVVGSYLKQVWSSSDPKVIMETFKSQFMDYERVRNSVPRDQVMEIRLEDISNDRDRVLSQLSAFLGVDNRFNGELFFNEKTNAGAYGGKLGPDVVQLIEAELSDWMQKHRYLD